MTLTADTRILITGSTGFIGSELAIRLARDTPAQLTHLVRPAAGLSPQARVAAACGFDQPRPPTTPLNPPSFRAFAADLERPSLGLSPSDRGSLADTDIIIHAAADTSLAVGRRCHATNRDGMARLLDLAAGMNRPPLFLLVSTAYAAGIPDRVVSEADGDPLTATPGYASAYTLSKAAAEHLLAASGLPHIIVRPSIVVGRTSTGCLASPLRIFDAIRAVRAFPVRADAVSDIVPLGFVVEGILRLLLSPSPRHSVYHLSGGPSRCISGRELAEVERQVNGRRVPVRLIDPRKAPPLDQLAAAGEAPSRAAAELAGFLPFLNLNTAFDSSRILSEFPDLTPHLTPARDCLLESGRLWVARRDAAAHEPIAPAPPPLATTAAATLRASPEAE